MQVKAKKWLPFVLFNLLIVAAAGLILRAFRVVHVPVLHYHNFMEAHSHFAFGGWGFMAMFLAFCFAFGSHLKDRKAYKYIFFAVLFSVWGMFLSFPFRGYAPVSTIFSTLYIWVTYWFAYCFYKDTKAYRKQLSLKFARAALFFLVFSSIGPYVMGVLMALGYRYEPKAMNAIYFYLHFQYNGWLIFGILALLFKWIENKKIYIQKKKGLLFFRLLFWSCIPAVLLSFLWANPWGIVFVIAGLAALTQLYALLPFFQVIYASRKEIGRKMKPFVQYIATGILVLFVIKYLFQALGAIPSIAFWTSSSRHVIIAYLHLALLGVITFSLLTYYFEVGIISLNLITRWGMCLFIIGFVLTEIILFAQGGLGLLESYIPNFGDSMFYTTIPLPLGVLLLFFNQIKLRRIRK